MIENNQDLAVALAWPEQTARADERWIRVFKGLKIIKNLNFKVGHSAVLLIQRKSGKVYYYDFGRYICPRGMGRARSVDFDPNLGLQTQAVWDNGELKNLKEILDELYALRMYTHGEGVLYCGLSYSISFEKAKAYADQTVRTGIIPYGAFAVKNNNCSRFVAQVMAKGMKSKDPRKKLLFFPNSIKASPISNVVYADFKHVVHSYSEGVLQQFTMLPKEGLSYLLKQMLDSFKRGSSSLLPKDDRPGEIETPLRASGLPLEAQWLGGIGEGAWWVLRSAGEHYTIAKYDKKGEKKYEVLAKSEVFFTPHEPYSFTYHFGVQSHQLMQRGKLISFKTIQIIYTQQNKIRYETEYFKIENSHG